MIMARAIVTAICTNSVCYFYYICDAKIAVELTANAITSVHSLVRCRTSMTLLSATLPI